MTIKERKTIRKYKAVDVDKTLIHSLLATASRAATMGNMQLYSVVETRDEEMKRALAPLHFNQPMVMGAPVVLTFVADFNRFTRWCELSDADAGYDNFLATHTRNIALLLIDIDNFKEFNRVYGRETGNAVMVKLARALSTAFRSTDFPCRIESDMFAVVMTNMDAGLRDAVSSKIGLVNSILADDSDDLPLITLSVGVAFSTEGMNDRDIYEAAESALEQAVEQGRNRIAFYGEATAK